MIFPAENLGFRGSRGSLAIESGRPAAVAVGACIITLDRLLFTLLFWLSFLEVFLSTAEMCVTVPVVGIGSTGVVWFELELDVGLTMLITFSTVFHNVPLRFLLAGFSFTGSGVKFRPSNKFGESNPEFACRFINFAFCSLCAADVGPDIGPDISFLVPSLDFGATRAVVEPDVAGLGDAFWLGPVSSDLV